MSIQGNNAKIQATDSTDDDDKKNKITRYFTQARNKNGKSAQIQSKQNQADVFSKALKKQLDCLSRPADTVPSTSSETKSAQIPSKRNQTDVFAKTSKIQSECQDRPADAVPSTSSEAKLPTYEELNDLVLKLERMLSDEKKAKKKLLEDYKALEQKYVSNLQAMVKTQTLLLKHGTILESKSTDAVNDAVSIEDNSNNQPTSSSEAMMSSNVEVAADISHRDIVKLNSIQPDKTHDATFITNLVEMLYADKNVLKCRSITGRSRTEGVTKHPITPAKMEIITSLFTKRIKDCSASNEEKVQRLAKSNINRMIAHTISNMTRTMKDQR